MVSSDKRGCGALKTNNFPLITDVRAISHRLDGLVPNEAEYESRSILAYHEENTLLAYLNDMNRCNQGVSSPGTVAVILKLLEIKN